LEAHDVMQQFSKRTKFVHLMTLDTSNYI